MTLKTCPFCGSNDIDSFSESKEQLVYTARKLAPGIVGQIYTECMSCGARGPKVDILEEPGDEDTNYFDRVRRNWNTRPIDTPLIGKDGKFLGYIAPRAITQEPQEGRWLTLLPLLDFPKRVSDISAINDTIEIIKCTWEVGRYQHEGIVWQGFMLRAQTNEDEVWRLNAMTFTPWPIRHGKRVN